MKFWNCVWLLLSTVSFAQENQPNRISMDMGGGFGHIAESNGFLYNFGLDGLMASKPIKYAIYAEIIFTEGKGDSRYQWESDNDICRDTENGQFAKESLCSDGEMMFSLDVDAGYYKYLRIEKNELWNKYEYDYLYITPGIRLGNPIAPYVAFGYRNISAGFFSFGLRTKIGYQYFSIGASLELGTKEF